METPETNAATYTGPRFFGAPVGDFSFFQTILFTFALTIGGMMVGTFLGIVGLMVWQLIGHHTVDYSDTYKYVGLPLSVLIFLASSIYLGSLYLRRILRKK